MENHLKGQTSPYLLQHLHNPVDWYPWCPEAFEKAKKEDKPIFLSIGYSTCHWCHVMARESFEDGQIASILNRYFVSIKVDREERPDIDSIYLSVCQAFTGSGGWPATIFMTPDQKPFFAGTYFPKTSRFGQPGFLELLLAIREKWGTDRESLIQSSRHILALLKNSPSLPDSTPEEELLHAAVSFFEYTYDKDHGGFGDAPKFPTPHNLLFLMTCYEKGKEEKILEMVEHTLVQMYRGGLFDHIGGGFCRYSTDRYFLVPHFEKMLYDNALLIMAYAKAYQLTGRRLYLTVAKRTASYVLEEMTSGEGGFYSAQDADSDGTEGKYYVFEPDEILSVLGEEKGEAFNRCYDITTKGNFFGKNIPNLLKNKGEVPDFSDAFPVLADYRKKRCQLHLDDKILTSWNSLMIAALCWLYRVSREEIYLEAAEKSQKFLTENLWKDDLLFASFCKGHTGEPGFLTDYSFQIFALLCLYEATFKSAYPEMAVKLCRKTLSDFFDETQGGFYLYGKEHEQLILRPKETYDGALPSGNSFMFYNLVKLSFLTDITEESPFASALTKQLRFMQSQASQYPAGACLFLTALSDYLSPPEKTVIVSGKDNIDKNLPCRFPLSASLRLLECPSSQYPLKNGKTTFYRCTGHTCLPPATMEELKFPAVSFKG